ncbi:TPA: GNAT family N-acetyltransferase [Vibrio vulnificus]|nr:GNAT family N-acetyltransferase [Vibrio vulnificus]
MNHVTHDEKNALFQVHLEGMYYATVRYQLHDDVMSITSTRVQEELRGGGYGKLMMEAVLPIIEAQGYKIVPVCSYVKHYLERHSEWHHLKA